MADIVAVIPARLGSKRFPRKVIYPYQRKPLLYYVWNEVRKSKLIDRVIIATDSREVTNSAMAFGAEVIKTSAKHPTGSDRVAEVMQKVRAGIVVNVQADNFGLRASVLDRVIREMQRDRSVTIATLAYRITEDVELYDTNVVKVVWSHRDGRALWFSRLPIPFVRDAEGEAVAEQFRYYGHIGIYFYRPAALAEFAGRRRGEFERAESLEQLRILENGGRIRVYETKMRPVSVDVRQDLKKLDRII